MATTTDEQGRPDPERASDEATTLTQFLDFHRATLEWKTRGVDDAGLAATLPTSAMTLGGLLTHLAWVEDYWFSVVLLGREAAPPWNATDWAADMDADWHWEGSGAQRRAFWLASTEASRAIVRECLSAPDGLERLAVATRNGEHVSLRWILVHMIEEYARHNGHADLLREAIDGSTGE